MCFCTNSANKYSERLLFHTFTIFRVMFRDTSEYNFIFAFFVANSKSFSIFRTWSAIYVGVPMSRYCRELVRRKPLGFGCIFLVHERKCRIGHWQDFMNGTGGLACLPLLYTYAQLLSNVHSRKHLHGYK